MPIFLDCVIIFSQDSLKGNIIANSYIPTESFLFEGFKMTLGPFAGGRRLVFGFIDTMVPSVAGQDLCGYRLDTIESHLIFQQNIDHL
jgi:hypothetical protein